MNNNLPKGFKAVDRAKLGQRLQSETVFEKGLKSLLVRDRDHKNGRAVDDQSKPEFRKVKRLSDIISNNIQAANDIRSITHFIKRAEMIWLTLLLKPNGEQKDLLTYDSEDSDIKNNKLHEILLQRIKNYFTIEYPFEEMPSQIIKDVMFRTGSYVLLNLPHSTLDHLINGHEVAGTESFKNSAKETLGKEFNGNLSSAKNIGWIRKTKPAAADTSVGGFEDLFDETPDGGDEYSLVDPDMGWTFTDNLNVLKAAELKQALRADKLARRGGGETLQTVLTNVFEKTKGSKGQTNKNNVGIAERSDLNKYLNTLYSDRRYRQNEAISLRRSRFYTGTGRGIGITYHVPSEACIPVHVNGEIGKPFGHIVMIDPNTGEFLKSTSDVKFYQSTRQANNKADNRPGAGSVNEMARHIKNVAAGQDCNIDMDWMIELSSAQLEKEFIEGFINGDLNKSVTVSLTEQNKKLFLARSLRQQGVRCVFVPSEYVTYIATNYSHLGIGTSLVEEAKLSITRLAILDTADALANIENAISKTELTIGIEEEDLDPKNTVAMIRDEYFANNPTLHDIIGFNNVSVDAVLDRFKEQTLITKVDAGNNKHIIAPTIEAQQAVREPLRPIDQSTREGLLNSISGHFWLKRSWLEDVGEGNDFAIEALADQELLRNQTAELSRVFSRFFSDFMRKHVKGNEPLLADLINIIRENKTLYMKPDQTGSLREKKDDLDERENDDKIAVDDVKDKKGTGKKAVEEEDVKGTKKPGKKDPKKEKEEGKEESGVSVEKMDETGYTEMDDVEIVLVDFLNNFFVSLPTPAINEALTKLSDKIDTIIKLVDIEIEMSGGAKRLTAMGEELFPGEPDLVGKIKSILYLRAFRRYNIPCTFETILANGDAGGILSIATDLSDMDNNVIKFMSEYAKTTLKTGRRKNSLQAQLDKINEKLGLSEEEEPEAQVDPMGSGESFLGEEEPDPFSDQELPPESETFKEEEVVEDDIANEDTPDKDAEVE